ncbi:outer membrane beta-barrel protein [Cysteiniphilum sp. QT6929]|uniref:outer membrane beta-barrel protein n=1 Tax=Cysteiniphilum sp. QT6929 TaxID=2975055 RepID=UPI0024B38233|nr:outer membrane beta-barrel protein [Cysteiniphilum sp. QT6929]WHN65002.1 outer membrane beta-barrel protein [Cysteiniphilum sp. QT6929]
MKKIISILSLALCASSVSSYAYETLSYGFVDVNGGYANSPSSLDWSQFSLPNHTTANNGESSNAFSASMLAGLGADLGYDLSLEAMLGIGFTSALYDSSATTTNTLTSATAHGSFKIERSLYVPILLGLKYQPFNRLSFSAAGGAAFLNQTYKANLSGFSTPIASDGTLSGFQPAMRLAMDVQLTRSLSLSASYLRTFGNATIDNDNSKPLPIQTFSLGLRYQFPMGEALAKQRIYGTPSIQ